MVSDIKGVAVFAGAQGAALLSSAARLGAARRVVIKIGSALLVDPETGLRARWLAGLAADVAMLRADGADVLLVSSGAIALGRRSAQERPGARARTGEKGAPLSLEAAQAAAAVGQIALARAYAEALGAHGLEAAQVLLTLGDTQHRRRYLNACATLETLIEMGAVPVVNENDTVATDEIRYGDNDRLAARIALMAKADALVLLSDVDGLYDANPRTTPNARRIAAVLAVTPALEAMAAGPGTPGAKGGMATKLMAAKTAMGGGCAMVVARGAPPDGAARSADASARAWHDPNRPIQALINGANATWFEATSSPLAARKQWIGGMKTRGALVIDAGAAAALARGSSLLPAGVRRVDGSFDRGDPVAVLTEDGASLGAALAGYDAEAARQICGLRTDAISEALGYPVRRAMAHADDMVLFGGAETGAEAGDAAAPKDDAEFMAREAAGRAGSIRG